MKSFATFCLIFLFSRCVEDETDLSLVYSNQLLDDITLIVYPHPHSGQDSSIITIGPNQIYEEILNSRGSSDSYPLNMHFPFSSAEMVRVYFNDTLSILHVQKSLDDTAAFSSLLYYSDDRNIFNPQSFLQQEVKDDFYRGTYTFDQADLDYAISVYE